MFINFAIPMIFAHSVKIYKFLNTWIMALGSKKRIILWLSYFKNLLYFLISFLGKKLSNLLLFMGMIIVLVPNFSISKLFIQPHLITKDIYETFKLGIRLFAIVLLSHKFFLSLLNALISLFFQRLVEKVVELLTFGFHYLIFYLILNCITLLLLLALTYSWWVLTHKFTRSDRRWITFL